MQYLTDMSYFLKSIRILIPLLLCGNMSFSQNLLLKDSIEHSGVRQIYLDNQDHLYILKSRELLKVMYPQKTTWSCQLYDEIEKFSVMSKFKIYIFTDNTVMILNQQLAPSNDNFVFDLAPLAVSDQQLLYLYDPAKSQVLVKDPVTDMDYYSFQIPSAPLNYLYFKKKLYILYHDVLSIYDDMGNLLEERSVEKGVKLIDGLGAPYLADPAHQTLLNLVTEEKLSVPRSFEEIAVGNKLLALSSGGKIYMYAYKK